MRERREKRVVRGCLAHRAQLVQDVKGGLPKSKAAEQQGVTNQAVTNQLKPSSLSRLAEAEEFGMNKERKRARWGRHKELDKALVRWLEGNAQVLYLSKLGLSRSVVFAKATELATTMGVTAWKPNPAWWSRFCGRFCFRRVRLHGEGGDVDLSKVKDVMNHIRVQLASFAPSHIFNMDETALFYRAIPNATYLRAPAHKTARGSKMMTDKSRITLVAACNADGSCKVPMAMLGTAANPRCFAVDGRVGEVPYMGQKSAWMDARVCEWWFGEVFLPCVRSFTSEPIALVWDGLAAHKIANAPPDVTIITLPPNVTSHHQPLDQGILASCKAKYRGRMIDALLTNKRSPAPQRKGTGLNGLAQGEKPHLRDVALLVSDAWQGVTTESIVNCWLKSQLLPPQHDVVLRNLSHKSVAKLGLTRPEEEQLCEQLRSLLTTCSATEVRNIANVWVDVEKDSDFALEFAAQWAAAA